MDANEELLPTPLAAKVFGSEESYMEYARDCVEAAVRSLMDENADLRTQRDALATALVEIEGLYDIREIRSIAAEAFANLKGGK